MLKFPGLFERIRGFVRRRPRTVACVLAVALLLVYSINEGARSDVKERENRAKNAIEMFNLQQSLGNLDQFVSKWPEVNGLGSGKNLLHPSKRIRLELEGAVRGMRMVVLQEWYTMRTLADYTPGLSAGSAAAARAATKDVLNDGQIAMTNAMRALRDAVRRPKRDISVKAKIQAEADEYKAMRSEYLSLLRTWAALKDAELRIIPQAYHIAAKNGFWYQALGVVSYFLYALVVAIGLLRDTWGVEHSRRNEKGNRPTLEKMARVLGDIDARLKTMEGK